MSIYYPICFGELSRGWGSKCSAEFVCREMGIHFIIVEVRVLGSSDCKGTHDVEAITPSVPTVRVRFSQGERI